MSVSLFSASMPDTEKNHAVPAAAPEDYRSIVRQMLAGLGERAAVKERRRGARRPFPFPVSLIPVAPDGQVADGKEIVVLGKQLSERGLDFYHREPLPYRRMIAAFESGGRQIRLLIDLTWCRFNRYGWYDSGGRFLDMVDSTLAEPPHELTA